MEAFEEGEISQTILECTNIYETYDTLPICMVIVAQELDESTLKYPPFQELPFFKDVKCTFWAKQFLVVSAKDSKIYKNQSRHHPLLDIITAVTSTDKVILENVEL